MQSLSVQRYLSFYGDYFLLFFQLLSFHFRNSKSKHTIFIFCFDVFLCQFLSYIKASAAGTAISFLKDILTCLFIFLLIALRRSGIDNKISIFQFCVNIFFFISIFKFNCMIEILFFFLFPSFVLIMLYHFY